MMNDERKQAIRLDCSGFGTLRTCPRSRPDLPVIAQTPKGSYVAQAQTANVRPPGLETVNVDFVTSPIRHSDFVIPK